MPVELIWFAAADGSDRWLGVGLAWLAIQAAASPVRLRRAWRRGRRLRTAAARGR
jgi:hypothetical protein